MFHILHVIAPFLNPDCHVLYTAGLSASLSQNGSEKRPCSHKWIMCRSLRWEVVFQFSKLISLCSFCPPNVSIQALWYQSSSTVTLGQYVRHGCSGVSFIPIKAACWAHTLKSLSGCCRAHRAGEDFSAGSEHASNFHWLCWLTSCFHHFVTTSVSYTTTDCYLSACIIRLFLFPFFFFIFPYGRLQLCCN